VRTDYYAVLLETKEIEKRYWDSLSTAAQQKDEQQNRNWYSQ